jgi:hypothetical protein
MRLADRDYGWTIEMQIRALQIGARVTEVPVHYRRRVGRSKISGTVSGSVRGAKILAPSGAAGVAFYPPTSAPLRRWHAVPPTTAPATIRRYHGVNAC